MENNEKSNLFNFYEYFLNIIFLTLKSGSFKDILFKTDIFMPLTIPVYRGLSSLL